MTSFNLIILFCFFYKLNFLCMEDKRWMLIIKLRYGWTSSSEQHSTSELFNWFFNILVTDEKINCDKLEITRKKLSSSQQSEWSDLNILFLVQLNHLMIRNNKKHVFSHIYRVIHELLLIIERVLDCSVTSTSS